MSHAANYVAIAVKGTAAQGKLAVQAKLHVALAYIGGESMKDFNAVTKATFYTVDADGKETVKPEFSSAKVYASMAWTCVRKMPGVAEVWAQDGAGISLKDAYAKCPKKANTGRTKKSALQRHNESWEKLSLADKAEAAKYSAKRLPECNAAAEKAAEVRKSLSVTTAEV